MKKNTIVSKNKVKKIFEKFDDDFALVYNAEYIHPPYEIYPLAPKIMKPLKKVKAMVMDMDGTTTTTEALCIHSLETMIRRLSGLLKKEEWEGLDEKSDYPNIIGNSTTKHVEFLVNRYVDKINFSHFIPAFYKAVLWTLFIGKDESRKREVLNHLKALGCKQILQDKSVEDIRSKAQTSEKAVDSAAEKLYAQYGDLADLNSFDNMVTAAIDIYYHRYHEILYSIENGKNPTSDILITSGGKALIEPMPGVAVFLALIKGKLGEEAQKVLPELLVHYTSRDIEQAVKLDIKIIKYGFMQLSEYFTKNPVKLGLVTSSIHYEADIVMKQVFNTLYREAMEWRIDEERKKDILDFFSDYNNVYDAFITASDSSEIRLKPHRDLYSIALNSLAVKKKDFKRVIGFEDSQSGTLAIRAAGIGKCIALPFAQTADHNLEAACHIIENGLPEVILKHNVFLKSITS